MRLSIVLVASSAARAAPCLLVERTRGFLIPEDLDNPISTRRRMASERVVSCCSAQLSTSAVSSTGNRTAETGSRPVAGRPRLFWLDVRADASPEEVFIAVGRLRKQARDEIDRLIQFLDKTDNYVSRELEDDGDREAVGDDEPSLGSFDRMMN
jgi:hypothetical protein